MAFNSNLGSLTPGRIVLPDAITEVMTNIQASLDAVNHKDDTMNQYKMREGNLLAPFVHTNYGESGKTVGFENFQIKFQNYNANSNPATPNTTRKTVTLYSQAYEVSNGSFTPAWFREVDKAGGNPYSEIEGQTDAIMNVYEQIFKNNHLWQSVLEVPTTAGDYYAKPGALRDVVVDASLLKNHDSGATATMQGSTTRLHWRGIEASVVAASDLEFVQEYMNGYKGVNIQRLIMSGTLTTRNALMTVFEDTITRDKVRMGQLDLEGATIINGIPFVVVDSLPNYAIGFVIADPLKPFIERLENKKEEYRDMNFVPERSFDKFGNNSRLEDLSGKFIIEDIGDALWGRHKVLFLDITPARYTANTTYVPNAALYTDIASKRIDLRNEWKEQGIIDKL